MAVRDLYNTLSDEQKMKIESSRSPEDLLAFLKAENIAFTEDHLEAICGWRAFGKKKKRTDIIETGLYGRFLEPSEEWPELLVEARSNEKAVRGSFPSEDDQEAAARRLIAGDNPVLQEALRSAADPEAFCDFCLSMRGPLPEGRQRRILREQARLLGYLANPALLPDSAEALLQLWETANRLEPRWYDDLPAHFRTSDEHIPFAHGRNPFEPGPLPPGYRTSPPEEIPEAISGLMEWIRRRDLSPELLAFSSVFLMYRIHPFSDGNGHTARLLCCRILSPHYSAVTLTVFIGLMHEFRRSVFDATMLADLSNGDLLPECCVLLRLLIRGQKRILNPEQF
ncbi:MAG: Fic family protein [Clostridia bacterium]|nr:Fic family protein [Clostridia bacterium]